MFQPFQIACRSGNPELLVIAIDCLGKLFSYNYWKTAAGLEPDNSAQFKKASTNDGEEEDHDNDGTEAIIMFVIDTICDGFSGESTDEKVQLQIIKVTTCLQEAFQAALTNADPAFSLHGAVLLKAIRTTYNIFLLSKSTHVQMVAQGTVLQMVQNVFGRIPKSVEHVAITGTEPKSSNKQQSEETDIKPEPEMPASINLNSNFEGGGSKQSNEGYKSQNCRTDMIHRREVNDAFKVFRTLCILSMKPIPGAEG